LLFLKDKLTCLGIDKLPARSTLRDANINRDSEVFGSIYALPYDRYKDKLTSFDCCLMFGESLQGKKLDIIDSSTVS
jgi:hypothetical protein